MAPSTADLLAAAAGVRSDPNHSALSLRAVVDANETLRVGPDEAREVVDWALKSGLTVKIREARVLPGSKLNVVIFKERISVPKPVPGLPKEWDCTTEVVIDDAGKVVGLHSQGDEAYRAVALPVMDRYWTAKNPAGARRAKEAIREYWETFKANKGWSKLLQEGSVAVQPDVDGSGTFFGTIAELGKKPPYVRVGFKDVRLLGEPVAVGPNSAHQRYEVDYSGPGLPDYVPKRVQYSMIVRVDPKTGKIDRTAFYGHDDAGREFAVKFQKAVTSGAVKL